jgi:glucose-6-phosphate dehydrogenase assembly protein OpcA
MEEALPSIRNMVCVLVCGSLILVHGMTTVKDKANTVIRPMLVASLPALLGR